MRRRRKHGEEAERKEKLGYDPDEETPAETTIQAAQPASSTTTIHQPTPVSPGRAGSFGQAGQSRQRSDSEMERLGMGVRRLGFGQVGSAAAKSNTAAPKAMGFGATSKPATEGPRPLQSLKHKLCNTDMYHQTTQSATPARNSARKKAYPPTNSSAATISTLPLNRKLARACKASKARLPSPRTRTLAGQRKTSTLPSTVAIWRTLPRTSYADSASRRATTLRI